MSTLNLDDLRAAADDLYRKLSQPSTPSHPVGEAMPPRNRLPTAGEADQMFRDEILARQINQQYNSSLIVFPSDSTSRPGPEMRQDRDEVVARQLQDQYDSSLAVEPLSRNERLPRYSLPPRYSAVVGEPFRRDDELLARPLQDQYNSSLVVEQDQDQRPPRYSSVVDREHSRETGRQGPRDDEKQRNHGRVHSRSSNRASSKAPSLPQSAPAPDSPRQHIRSRQRHQDQQDEDEKLRTHSPGPSKSNRASSKAPSLPQSAPDSPRQHIRSTQRHRDDDEALRRQLQDQYNSSLDVNPSALPPRYTPATVGPSTSRPTGQPLSHELPFNTSFPPAWDEDRLPSYHQFAPELHPGHWPEKYSDRPLVDLQPEKEKEHKKPQIRAKDYEEKLRWLACRRTLGKK